MNNCNLKTLKGEINNINLPYLDFFKVYFKKISDATNKSNGLRSYPAMATKVGNDYVMRCIGDVSFADSSLVSTGNKEITVPGHESAVYLTNENGALLISKKTTVLSAVASAASVNKAYYIKTAEFKDTTVLTVIAFGRTDSIGSIYDFSQCIGLTDLNFSGALEIEGDISKFVEMQIDEYGRTSGNITITLANTRCSVIPGTPCTTTYTCVITDSTHFSITNSAGNYHWNGTKSGGNWSIEFVVDQ